MGCYLRRLPPPHLRAAAARAEEAAHAEGAAGGGVPHLGRRHRRALRDGGLGEERPGHPGRVQSVL